MLAEQEPKTNDENQSKQSSHGIVSFITKKQKLVSKQNRLSRQVYSLEKQIILLPAISVKLKQIA